MVQRLLIVLLVLGTTGCQTTVPRSSPSTETSFTDLWNTYRHCQASDNPHEMKADALHLGESLSTMHDKARYALIPDGIERLVDERPSRLAIDPGAMAASCALLAGYQARATGRPELGDGDVRARRRKLSGHTLSVLRSPSILRPQADREWRTLHPQRTPSLRT